MFFAIPQGGFKSRRDHFVSENWVKHAVALGGFAVAPSWNLHLRVEKDRRGFGLMPDTSMTSRRGRRNVTIQFVASFVAAQPDTSYHVPLLEANRHGCAHIRIHRSEARFQCSSSQSDACATARSFCARRQSSVIPSASASELRVGQGCLAAGSRGCG